MEGNPVDWWVAIKLPGGDNLAYLDSQAAAEFGVEARFRYRLTYTLKIVDRYSIGSFSRMEIRMRGGRIAVQ